MADALMTRLAQGIRKDRWEYEQVTFCSEQEFRTRIGTAPRKEERCRHGYCDLSAYRRSGADDCCLFDLQSAGKLGAGSHPAVGQVQPHDRPRPDLPAALGR